MNKRTGHMKNRRSIKELQKSLTSTKKALRQAKAEVDWLSEILLKDRAEIFRRIRFTEQDMIVRHEQNKHYAEICREKGYLENEEDQKRFDETMNYKFPVWIEEDRKRGLYNLNTGQRANA